jgi:hypothetical protein
MSSARIAGLALAALASTLASCDRSASPAVPAEGSAADPPAPEAPTSREGDLRIGEGFTETTVRAQAGGTADAAAMAPPCGGQMGELPDLRLVVDTLQPLTLSATPQGRGLMDLSLVVRDEEGRVTCADDSLTLDPVLAELFEPGVYEVWVAARSEFEVPYALDIRHGNHAPDPIALGGVFPPPVLEGTPPTTTTQGTFGGLQLGADSAHITLRGQTDGAREAIDLGADCVGWIAQVPDHVLEVSVPQTYTLRVRAEGDTTLVVQGPNAVWCTDDDDGLNPVLREAFAPGAYSVYVGAFEQADELSYSLAVSR